jgi:hypothetical protein
MATSSQPPRERQDEVEPDELRRYHEAVATFRAPGRAPGLPEGGRAGPVVPDALGFLHCRWRLDRRLVDHATACSGTFSGTAQFAPLAAAMITTVSSRDVPRNGSDHGGAAVLSYHEQGELRFRGHRGSASRSLIYRGRPDGTADVFFADGREFYLLDPRSGRWRGEHQCGADHYAVAGQVLGSGSFEERWRVRGPDKDYEIMTTLVRA